MPVLAMMLAGTAANPGFMGGIARAATPGTDCGVDGQTIVTLSSQVSKVTLTHVRGISVAPGTTFSSTTAATFTYQLTAGIDGTITESLKADAIILKADASVSISLHETGSKTSTTTNSVTWTSGPAVSYARTYAIFAGGTRVTGHYTYQVCGRTFKWGPIYSGVYGSWGADREGSAKCGTTYASGSIERAAQLAIGSCAP